MVTLAWLSCADIAGKRLASVHRYRGQGRPEVLELELRPFPFNSDSCSEVLKDSILRSLLVGEEQAEWWLGAKERHSTIIIYSVSSMMIGNCKGQAIGRRRFLLRGDVLCLDD